MSHDLNRPLRVENRKLSITAVFRVTQNWTFYVTNFCVNFCTGSQRTRSRSPPIISPRPRSAHTSRKKWARATKNVILISQLTSKNFKSEKKTKVLFLYTIIYSFLDRISLIFVSFWDRMEVETNFDEILNLHPALSKTENNRYPSYQTFSLCICF